MELLNYWLDVEDAAGNKVGKGPLRIQRFTHRIPLSASGSYSFVISAADPNLAALQEKRVVRCRYIDCNGNLCDFSGGIVDQIKVTAENGQVLIETTGNDETEELGYRSVGSLLLADGEEGVLDSPDQVMAYAPSGWSIIDGSITGSAVYAGFDGESVLNAMVKISSHIGEHWVLSGKRELTWIGSVESWPSSMKRAVQHINDPYSFGDQENIVVIRKLEEVRDATQLLSRVIPRGSGTGSTILTLANVSDSAPTGYTLDKTNNYLKRDDTESAYGWIEKALDFKEIGPLSNTAGDIEAAANMLMRASYEYLRRYGQISKFYTLDVVANTLLSPGTTIHVVYRKTINGVKVLDVNDVLNIIAVEHTIDEYGIYTSRIEVSTIDRLPMTDEEYLAGEMQSAKVLSTHQQLGPSVDTLPFTDEMDIDYAASFQFWLGDEYTSIQRAILRFEIIPLRSTVKSVAGRSTTTYSGGSSSPTTGSGGAAVKTTSSVGGGTPTGGAHSHAALNLLGGGHAHSTNPHQHTIDIPSHQHTVDIPNHTHNLTPNIDMEYGIFEEESGNTLDFSDLVIQLNDDVDLSSFVVSEGNGVYRLNFTQYLVDDVFRPNQEKNIITISTAVDKTARIKGQVTIRGVVQAVNYEG